MSTRANIVVRDGMNDIQLYKHSDGYPSGAVPAIQKALQFSWKLPRFEATDFAAAFVRANKDGGGQIYIDGTYEEGVTEHGDIEYLYFVELDNESGTIKVSWKKDGKEYICQIINLMDAQMVVERTVTERVNVTGPDALARLLCEQE